MTENNIIESAAEMAHFVGPDHPSLQKFQTPYYIGHRELHTHSLEKMLPQPVRIREKIDFGSPTGFLAYVDKYAKDTTALFLDNSRLLAEFDYSQPGSPQWKEHSAKLVFEPTESWKQWGRMNKTWMTQQEFAFFLEDRHVDIVEPIGIDVLNMAQKLRATIKHNFESEITTTGVNVKFEKTSQVGTVDRKEVGIPSALQVQFVPYMRVESLNNLLPEDLKIAAFKHRVRLICRADEGGTINFKYEIPDYQPLLESFVGQIGVAFNYLLNQNAQPNTPTVPIYFGA